MQGSGSVPGGAKLASTENEEAAPIRRGCGGPGRQLDGEIRSQLTTRLTNHPPSTRPSSPALAPRRRQASPRGPGCGSATECSVDAVDRKGDAVTESLQLTKSKTEHRRGVLEQAAALPRNDRIDEEPVLVDESGA